MNRIRAILVLMSASSLCFLGGGVGGCCPSGSEVVTTDAHWELTDTSLSNITISVTVYDGSDVPVDFFDGPDAPIAASFDPTIGSVGFFLYAEGTAVDVFFCEPDIGEITAQDTADGLLSSPYCKVAYLGLSPEPDSCQETGHQERICDFTLEAESFQIDSLVCHFDEASSTQTCIGDDAPVFEVYYSMQAETVERFIPEQVECL